MVKLCGKSKQQQALEARKLAFLRAELGANLPDIYAIAGLTLNGLGPENWKSEIIHDLLNHMPWDTEAVEAAGDYHDYLYWLGGTEAAREVADAELKRLILATRKWRWSLRGIACYFAVKGKAKACYAFVRLGGRTHFSYTVETYS